MMVMMMNRLRGTSLQLAFHASCFMYVIIVLAIAGIRHTSAVLYRIPLKHSKGATNEAVQEEGVIEVTADNLHGKPGEGYYIEMGLGTPPQFVSLVVETFSLVQLYKLLSYFKKFSLVNIANINNRDIHT